MQKLWKVVRVILMGVGALTLALILWVIFVTSVKPMFMGRGQQETRELTDRVIFEKSEDGYQLKVERKETKGPDKYLLSLSREGRQVVREYRLPVEKYQVEYLDIYDAAFVALRGGDEGVILFAEGDAESECSSESIIWVIRASRETSVRDVIRLTDVHRTDQNGLQIVGTKQFALPYQQGFRFETYVVPVIVRVGDAVTVSPILGGEGVDALRASLSQEVRMRLEKVPQDEKGKKLEEQYRKAEMALNEFLTERMISF